MRANRLAALAVTAALCGAACGGPAPSPSAASVLPLPNAAKVTSAITEAGVRAQLDRLASASAGSDTFRAAGTPGYDAAVEIVRAQLSAAGWTVTEDRFTAPVFEDEGGSRLEVGRTTFDGAQVKPLIFGPSGEAEGPVVAIDWDPNATGPGTKGCVAADYGNLPPHAIVLVRSGPCYRRDEVLAAQTAGAAGFVAFIPGLPPGVVLRPTLIAPDGIAIPVASVSAQAAQMLADTAASGGTARLETHARTRLTETRSILAELPGETGDAVVMLGAHLDSVIDGPGINDDASGVAALLELASALAGTQARATIRLAFWTGEEEGLQGSAHYASALARPDAQAIVAYLNADMLGSANGFVGVYDEPTAPSGSAAVRALLMTGLQRLGAKPVGINLGGGSDHVPFQQVGIPTGGVFSGASEVLDQAQAATFGGKAGARADACYHRACDGTDNVNLPLARLLAAGLADLTVQLAITPTLIQR
jgi:Zn-dependent M28 family amino/carboxypeptidase